VGSKETPFIVHKQPIGEKSPFFESALSREWVEGREKRLPLPTISGRSFQLYLHWVYTSRINLSVVRPGQEEDVDGSDIYLLERRYNQCLEKAGPEIANLYRDIDLLAELYVAANMLLDVDCPNKATDVIIADFIAIADLGRHLIDDILVTLVWNNTTRNAPLRLLFVDH
jgi:hypothetical protein